MADAGHRPAPGARLHALRVLLDQFILSVSKGPKVRRFLTSATKSIPAAQLMGSEPRAVLRRGRQAGGRGFDVIDINFGCPVKKVLGPLPRRLPAEHARTWPWRSSPRTRDAVPPQIPVTVKMRRGMDDSPQSRDRFFAIFDGAFARGAAAITVHGRTVRQRYEGPSSWDFLAEVKRHAGRATVLGQRRPVHRRRFAWTMIAADGRGRRDGRPRGDRQSLDFRPGPGAGGRRCPCPRRRALHEQREVIAEHFRLAEELYGAERLLRPDAQVRHQVFAVASRSP